MIADVQVSEFSMSRPGAAGDSDKVSITLENRGPSNAFSVDIALMEFNDRAPSAHLLEAVESVDAGKSYFKIPWELEADRPLEKLSANTRITFPFWFRYRLQGNIGLRIVWEDGRGTQVARPFIQFDQTPTWRY